MVGLQQRCEVLYGHFAEFADSLEEVNSVLRSRGWAEFAMWIPMGGNANEVVLTSDYPDLAAYKREEDAAHADAEFMKAWRQGFQYVAQGSSRFEILEPVPHLA